MDTVNILVSADSNYLPPLGVMLHSLVSARRGDRHVEVYLLCHTETLDGMLLSKLENQLREYDNMSLQLIDVAAHHEMLSSMHLGHGYVPAAYYRLLAPVLLPHIEKILYLDCDLIVKDDITELYDINIGNSLVAAIKDTVIIGFAFSPVNNFKGYLTDLGISDACGYFNSGVLLMNLASMRDEGLCAKMLQFAQEHSCHWVDQDVFNYFCQGRVLYLNKVWNSQLGALSIVGSRYVPKSEWETFISGRINEKISHFTDAKPWNDPGAIEADIWWSYARQTQWYELLLQRLVKQQSSMRSIQEEINTALKQVYSANWLRGNLNELSKWNEAHIYAGLVDLAYERENIRGTDDTNLERLKTSRVVFYGAGYWCRSFLRFFDIIGLDYPGEIWDTKAKIIGERLYGVPLHNPDFETSDEDALFVITVQDSSVNKEVSQKCKNVLTHGELKAALARALWLKKEREIGRTAMF